VLYSIEMFTIVIRKTNFYSQDDYTQKRQHFKIY